MTNISAGPASSSSDFNAYMAYLKDDENHQMMDNGKPRKGVESPGVIHQDMVTEERVDEADEDENETSRVALLQNQNSQRQSDSIQPTANVKTNKVSFAAMPSEDPFYESGETANQEIKLQDFPSN